MSDLKLAIDHDWTVTYQREPIRMRGLFASVEAFERSRAEWLKERNVIDVRMCAVIELPTNEEK
jgi:hypothetical protein